MINHITTSVIERKQVAAGTFEVSFDTSQIPFPFMAGQYATVTMLALSDLPIPEQVHDFSICSSPNTKDRFSIAFRNSESKFKKTLLDNSTENKVLLEGSKGIFTLTDDSRKVVFIAGGIGITPFLSMIRWVAESGQPYTITLFYYNSTKDRAAYLKELKGLAKKHDNISLVSVLGQLNGSHIKKSFANHNLSELKWYIAGPPGMVSRAREELVKINIKDNNIKTEEFSGY